ncbi:hypothetical protein [Stutzerimonas stutzeri]|jgi:hypothetical protein|uniref:DUF2232 domain-containing protein n=1 Tax=Stutzerimonas stutzeri TaxID=316 RepID=A0A2N8SU94_STUST|nr:hypothetical protein [Stutzerimonas stutzeri]EQM79657.1 membrane protein [Stutzerimonas stutzeri MF28]MCI0918628.1 hypothetical protein [Stutzerimonas stutzeri]MCQ4249018.1 hypothetical protein [Stutzerimonas stutzeri]PNG06043.1 hypothetical protein CXL00_09470 [Stutzerimonas stutzeri]QUE75181.1 hypothetical protein KCX70_18375 [Stutzerimonas stutzeri]
MRALADFIMRGRMQAIVVVAGAAALPMLFWLCAAAGSLVLLRRGLNDALGVLVWAVLPALAWWYFGDPRTLLVLSGSFGLALLLRNQNAWHRVMLCSVGLGLLYAWALGMVFGEPIAALAAELQKMLPDMLSDAYQQLSVEEQARLGALLIPVLTGLLAALLQITTLLSLMLGRYWQALLYNPGGFGLEFRALRFSPAPAMVLLAGMLLAPSLGVQAAMLAPLCSVPLVFAGIALVHGLVAQNRMSRFWLVGLYVTLALFMQLIYPLLAILAIVDSLFDFRGRASRDDDAGPANGEG